MMRTTTRVLVLASLLVYPLASAQTLTSAGPMTGTVKQGETDEHHFDNHPALGGSCLQVMVDYTVSLSWAPATDSLTLDAAGRAITGTNGYTAVGFQASYCTAFDITVTGTNVELISAYEITVTRTMAGGGA